MSNPQDLQRQIADSFKASLDPSRIPTGGPELIQANGDEKPRISAEAVVAFDDLQKQLNADEPIDENRPERQINRQPMLIAVAMFAMAGIITAFELVI